MKFIITENKMTQVQIKWLNNTFGDLERIVNDYNVGYFDKDGTLLFHNDINDNIVYVNYDKIWSLFYDFFKLEYYEVKSLLQQWLAETYGIIDSEPIINRGQYNYIQ